jgi:hypothetical protein
MASVKELKNLEAQDVKSSPNRSARSPICALLQVTSSAGVSSMLTDFGQTYYIGFSPNVLAGFRPNVLVGSRPNVLVTNGPMRSPQAHVLGAIKRHLRNLSRQTLLRLPAAVKRSLSFPNYVVSGGRAVERPARPSFAPPEPKIEGVDCGLISTRPSRQPEIASSVAGLKTSCTLRPRATRDRRVAVAAPCDRDT